MTSLEDEEMDKLKEELEVLKSWGIESVPVDKVLRLIKGEEVTFRFPLGEQSTVIPSTPTDLIPVGGIIFHIDDTTDGVYEFFDAYGNIIESVQVGDRPHAYRVIKKGSKDKYYVYHDEVYDKLEWTYYKGDVPVYESFLGITGYRGSGKTTTEIVMTKDNGAYITDNSDGCPTIWYRLQQVRDVKVGGCDDWFVPSEYEMEKLRKAILSGSVTGGKIAGSSYKESIFSRKWLWSSSGFSSQRAWLWGYNSQYWYGSSKSISNSVFFTRAF